MDHPLLQSLFDVEEKRPQSVTELNADVRTALERKFASVWVEGEITGFHSASSGHWYFSLTEGISFLKAACYRGQNYRIRFKPFDGLQVRVRGRLSVFEPRGEYQLMVESIEPVGEGALTVAFEQIKAKLAAEGLFDEAAKRPIPPFPRRVGVVTSPAGAAIHDVLTVLKRRARSVSVVIIPTLVQGEMAGEQITRAIRLANAYCKGCPADDRIDVLIVTRGGGSTEDLWAFNEEQVARAIRASDIPVISAVGHEIDFTIADMAADLRAPTPSAAAEIVAKAEAEVIEHLNRSSGSLSNQMLYRLMAARSDLQELAMSPVFSDFPGRIRDLQHRIEGLDIDAEFAVNAALQGLSERLKYTTSCLAPMKLAANVAENKRRLSLLEHRSAAAGSELAVGRHRKLETTMARLDALSPLSVLHRGYSITQKTSGEIVRNAHQTQTGERLRIRLAKGRLEAEIINVED